MKMDNKRGAAVIAEWPKRVPLSTLDKLLMLLTLAVMLVPLVHLAINYAALPAEVATDYNAAGEVIDWDAKWFLLILAGRRCAQHAFGAHLPLFPGRDQCAAGAFETSGAGDHPRHAGVHQSDGNLLRALSGYMLEVFLRCARGTPTEMSGWAIGAFVVLIFGSMVVYFLWLWKSDGPEKTAVPPRSKLNTEAGKIIGQWPKRLPLSLLDKIMIGISALLVVLALARLAMVYGDLPEVIPSHYGLNGEVDGTGGKSTLLILAAWMSLLGGGVAGNSSRGD